MARALLLAAAAIISCSTSNGGAGTGAPGPQGPTSLVVSWTFGGSPASGASCAMAGAAEVFVNLSGTFNPTADQSVTVYCSAGAITLSGLLVQDLGTASHLTGTLLDSNGATVPMGVVGVDVTPTLGTTAVTLAFFPSQSTGGGGAGTSTSTSTSTSTTTSTATSSSGGGAGGAPSTSSTSSTTTTTTTTTAASGAGGAGGAPSTSSTSSTTTTSSSSSTTTTSSGNPDAGDGG
jgi:hypothetical protein